MLKQPNDCSRRVLLAVTGLTPQIVTETLYALVVTQTPSWVPTEIRVITTREGAKRLTETLLEPNIGQFHEFCRQYAPTSGIKFDPSSIRLIHDKDGRALDDIRSPEDNTRAADTLLDEVRTLCMDDECAVHVSIAGGRASTATKRPVAAEARDRSHAGGQCSAAREGESRRAAQGSYRCQSGQDAVGEQ